MMDRTGMPLQGRLLVDVLQDQKSNGKWDGDPDEFFTSWSRTRKPAGA